MREYTFERRCSAKSSKAGGGGASSAEQGGRRGVTFMSMAAEKCGETMARREKRIGAAAIGCRIRSPLVLLMRERGRRKPGPS
jgi:hypothetical protein